MATVDYQRTRARIVRAGNDTTHLSIPAWCHGQITVPVLTLNLMAATGLACHELPGTELIITANLAAVTDTEVDPHAFQVAHASARRSAARRALSAAA
jgi:hypothetical protein